MQIQSFSNPLSPSRVSRPAQPSLNSPIGDGFQASFQAPDPLIPNRYIQSPGGGGGGRQALQFAGIGVMFGGILASTNLPGGWVGVGIIGSMCAGLALMSLANK